MADEPHPPHVLDSLILTFEALRDNTAATSRCLAATSALIAAVSEQLPQLAERYETYRKSEETNAPESRAARVMLARLDAVIRETKERRGW